MQQEIFTRRELAIMIASQFNRKGFADIILRKIKTEKKLIREFEIASKCKIQRFGLDRYKINYHEKPF